MSAPAAGAEHPVALVSTAREPGGAEAYLAGLAEELRGQVPLVALVPADAPAELARALGETGVEALPVRGLARLPSPAAVARLAAALRSLRPALVHVNLSDQGDGLAAFAAAALARRPVTATLHLVIPRSSPALERVARAALRRARRVIGVSESVGAYLGRLGVPSAVVRNGIVAPEPHPGARVELGLGETDLVVGGIGRLDPQKGWDVLCAAAPLIRERVPGARLVVIGAGPERERLAGLGARSGVTFAGYRERAGRFVGAFDVAVVPSRYEGFGLVALEAMLAGVPVVASATGGLPEVVGDAGLLVAPEDPQALAAAVSELLEQRERARELAERARGRAEQSFGRARMAAETLAVWRAAVGRPSNLGPVDEPRERGR